MRIHGNERGETYLARRMVSKSVSCCHSWETTRIVCERWRGVALRFSACGEQSSIDCISVTLLSKTEAVLTPKQKWLGKETFEFSATAVSDSGELSSLQVMTRYVLV